MSAVEWIRTCGLRPTGVGAQGVALVVVLIAVLSLVQYVVSILSDRKPKEAPMKKTSKLALYSVISTCWAMGTSKLATHLPT